MRFKTFIKFAKVNVTLIKFKIILKNTKEKQIFKLKNI